MMWSCLMSDVWLTLLLTKNSSFLFSVKRQKDFFWQQNFYKQKFPALFRNFKTAQRPLEKQKKQSKKIETAL